MKIMGPQIRLLLSYSVSKHPKTSLQTPLPTLDLGSCRTYYSITVLHFVMLVPMSSGRGILRYKHPTNNHTQPKARKLHYGLSKIFQHTSSSLSPQASKVTYDWDIYYVLIDHFESNPRYSLVQCHWSPFILSESLRHHGLDVCLLQLLSSNWLMVRNLAE